MASGAGVPRVAFVPNLLGVALGSAALWFGGRAVRSAGLASLGAALLATCGIGGTLLAPGIDGVHRWVALGPVRLNMSAALAPLLLLVFSAAPAHARWGLLLALAVQGVHLAQPDAAQATALALGSLPFLVGGLVVRRSVGLPLALLFLLLAALTWTRKDPLPALPHVEGILALAWGRGSLWGLLSSLSLALLPAVILWNLHSSRDPLCRQGALGALGYLAGVFAATRYGHFPVPVLGAGAGPVLGWYALLLCVGPPRPGHLAPGAMHPSMSV